LAAAIQAGALLMCAGKALSLQIYGLRDSVAGCRRQQDSCLFDWLGLKAILKRLLKNGADTYYVYYMTPSYFCRSRVDNKGRLPLMLVRNVGLNV
jgi:hypothetical protein